VLLFAGIGPRSAAAGGALRDTSGSTTAVGLSTPGGAFVVRLESGALQAASAAAVATNINVNLEFFMRSPGWVRAVRELVHRPRVLFGAGHVYPGKVGGTAISV
jgi:hypothetical protein